MPLLQGLQLLAKRKSSPLTTVYQLLCYQLQQGQTLTTALTQQKDFFPPLAVALVAAGEKSGQLPAVLEEIYQHYQQREELRSFLLKTALYPLFLLGTAGCVLLFFLLYVLPLIAGTVLSLKGQASPLLQYTLQLSAFAQEHTLPLLLLAVLLLTLCYSGRRQLGKLLLRLPPVQHCQQQLAEARFCKLLALLLTSGLPLSEAVPLAAQTLSDLQQQSCRFFEHRLQEGVPLSNAVQLPGLFAPATQELLTLGAATGYLPRMLQEAARLQEQELRQKLTTFKELFGPSLLLVAALLTAAVICTALQPLFQLFTAIPIS